MDSTYTTKFCLELDSIMSAGYNNRRNILNKSTNYDYASYISKFLDDDVREKFVVVLSTCDCCERHQKDRPKEYKPWTDTPFSNTQHTDCECRCRHLSRWVCRTCE